MAETHLGAYREIDDARVAAVASPNTAAEFVDDHGLDAETYSSVEGLVAAEIDAVDVCSPTPTHGEAVHRAIERGLDVFCEKPLALGLDEAERMRDAAEAAGVTLMPGHVLRFFPAYAEIRRAIAEGAVGAPGTVRARRVSPFPEWSSWYADEERSGGVFHDLAIHEFDFCRWAIGDVERVFARESRWDDQHRGTATLAFENGAVGTVEAGWDRPPGAGLKSEFEVAGADGLLEYDSETAEPIAVETVGETPTPGPPVERDGYRRELDAFLASARSGAELPVTAGDAVEAMRIAIAARRSAEHGTPVSVAGVGR